MTDGIVVLAAGLFFLIATLYATIGHAGASGYLAVMAWLGFASVSVKPTSLVLNIVVSLIASVQFIRAGRFDRKVFWSLILPSLPMAFVGGYIEMDPNVFKLAAGAFLVVAALLLLLGGAWGRGEGEARPMPLWAGIAVGAAIGFVSGFIGVGGGIFLTPIIVLARWTTVQKASGVSALFILCNSISGLLGGYQGLVNVDARIGYWILAVVAGGLLGSWLGTKRLGHKGILFFLILVLLSAGLKFMLVDFKP